jgi:hypothetical protein
MDKVAQGHASRRRGFFGECVVQTIAAAAHLTISREILEPQGIDFQISHESHDRKPRHKRIEIQVKTRSTLHRGPGRTLQVSLDRSAYHAINGRPGFELDIPRYLVLVSVPPHFSQYCTFTSDRILLANLAYWHNLMGEPDLRDGQGSVTVSVPEANLLTPEALVALTCGDTGEAAQWMSA